MLLKTDEEWQKELSELEFSVTRLKGTERAFTGEYLDNKKSGIYECRCCGQKLFSSDSKYDSKSGWPSFFNELDGAMKKVEDFSHGMHRIEIVCSNCGAHIGHLFDDGPKPTGLRYCTNSVSLKFKDGEN